jgi:fatty acyl-CoA reductase
MMNRIIFLPVLFAVISTYEEPVAGWVDNYYGLIGIVVGILMGGIRNLFAKKDGVVYCIPCDFVANVILAATCDLAKKR